MGDEQEIWIELHRLISVYLSDGSELQLENRKASSVAASLVDDLVSAFDIRRRPRVTGQ